jgi:hypothetical protein
MTENSHASTVGIAETLGGAEIPVRSYVKAIATWVSARAEACANYLAAAAIYEHLSGLSDAELHRRCLSRSTLARDVSVAFGGS